MLAEKPVTPLKAVEQPHAAASTANQKFPSVHVPVNLKVDAHPSAHQPEERGVSKGEAALYAFGAFALGGLGVWAWQKEKQNKARWEDLRERQEYLHRQFAEFTSRQTTPDAKTSRFHVMDNRR